MINEIPDWLRSFRITVINQSDILLFDSWEDEIKHLKFDHPLGGQKGTKMVIDNHEYVIDGIRIYTENTTIKRSEELNKYTVQITIVVL